MSLLRPICSTLRSPRIPQIALSFRPASSKTVTNPQSGVPEPSPALPAHQPSELTQSDLQQAPNTPTTWSTSQNPKPFAYDNPRFEQVRWDMQPNSLSGMGLGAMDPVRLVEGRKATCDGGGGALGHPKIFINLDKPGPKACGYCGIKFEQAHAH